MEQNKNCKKGCDLKGNRSHDNGGIDDVVYENGGKLEGKNQSSKESFEKFDNGGEIVNDKYYILSFGNYIQVKFIEKINIQGIDLFLYNVDGYFGVADEKTGIRIGGSVKEKDRAIDNANDFIEHHGEEKVIEHIKNAQLSPRYSKEAKTFEESQFEKIKELYESKNFEKLYEIISNNANTTSRKALSQILERSIVNYNNSQILDLFLEFGYDVRKINLENERLKKQKEAELKQAEIDKQNEYKKTEYPYLDLSNMSAKQFGVLDKAMQKKYRYPDGVKTVSEHIKSLKDEIVETKEFVDEFTKSGDRRSKPLHEYYVKLQSGSLWSIPKLTYDNWVGFDNQQNQDQLQGGLSDNKTIEDIAKKHDVSLDFANEQFEKGIAVELEHTDNRDIASEIALDHLWESIFYYEELEKMEDKLEGKNQSSKESFESEGSQTGKGKLYEFFTPQLVADKMIQLAYKYGFKGGNVLEPAAGNGRLVKDLKSNNLTLFEINPENVKQLKINFTNANIYDKSFETAFLKEPRYNSLLDNKATKTWIPNAPFDLVIANPPYGKYAGFYSSYFKFKGQFEHFFILQTLKVLKSGGIGVYLIPSSFMRNGDSYNLIKKQIFEMAKLTDAYRLPSNIFKNTQIGTDILVLTKK